MVCHRADCRSIRAFVLKSKSDNTGVQQVLVLSGPETVSGKDSDVIPAAADTNEEITLFQVTLQYPVSVENQCCESVVVFSLRETHLCVDPLFCEWMTYIPKTRKQYAPTVPRLGMKLQTSSEGVLSVRRYKKTSEMGSETAKQWTPHSAPSVHSSDKERENSHANESTSKAISTSASQEENKSSGSKSSWKEKFLPWFTTWRSLIICGDLEGGVIFFPTFSLSSVDAGNIEETVKKSLDINEDLEIILLRLPTVTIRNTSQRQGLFQHTSALPIKLPKNVWEPSKYTFLSIRAIKAFVFRNTLHTSEWMASVMHVLNLCENVYILERLEHLKLSIKELLVFPVS